MSFRDFLRQPTTVGGLAALFGTLEAILSGQMNWQAALPLIAGALVSIVLPDNSGAKADAEAMIRAAETLAAALATRSAVADSKTEEKS